MGLILVALVIIAMLLGMGLGYVGWRLWLREPYRGPHACPACGYDLGARASPATCPECGKVTPLPVPRPTARDLWRVVLAGLGR